MAALIDCLHTEPELWLYMRSERRDLLSSSRRRDCTGYIHPRSGDTPHSDLICLYLGGRLFRERGYCIHRYLILFVRMEQQWRWGRLMIEIGVGDDAIGDDAIWSRECCF